MSKGLSQARFVRLQVSLNYNSFFRPPISQHPGPPHAHRHYSPSSSTATNTTSVNNNKTNNDDPRFEKFGYSRNEVWNWLYTDEDNGEQDVSWAQHQRPGGRK